MSDIAQACGVSRSVVSLVLNGREKEVGIAQQTRDRIMAAAEELGYCRNELARAMELCVQKDDSPILVSGTYRHIPPARRDTSSFCRPAGGSLRRDPVCSGKKEVRQIVLIKSHFPTCQQKAVHAKR